MHTPSWGTPQGADLLAAGGGANSGGFGAHDDGLGSPNPILFWELLAANQSAQELHGIEIRQHPKCRFLQKTQRFSQISFSQVQI